MKKRFIIQLNGFTFIEILIALIISGILLLLALNVIQSMLEVKSLQRSNSNKNYNLLLIERILKDSFNSALTIEVIDENNLFFIFNNMESRKISFQPSVIIVSTRISNDTIKMEWDRLQILLRDSTYRSAKGISFIVKQNGIENPVSFRKVYTNQEMYYQ